MRDMVRADTVRVLIDDRGAGRGRAAPIAAAPCRKPKARSNCSAARARCSISTISKTRSTQLDQPARAAAVRRLDHHRRHRGADRHRREFRKLHGLDRPRRDQRQGQSRSRRRDRPSGSPARHRRTDRRRFHSSERAGEHSAKCSTVLAASLSKDHTPTQISPMSEFGLVEITRKRVRDPLVKLMSECCRPCSGHGRKRTRDSVALEVHAPASSAKRPRRAGQADRRARVAGGRALAGRSWRGGAHRARPPRRARA